MSSELRQLIEQNPRDYDLAFLADEWTLERFLRAKKGNQKEATCALRKTSKWRVKQSIASFKPEDFTEQVSTGLLRSQGTDLKGRPVFYFFANLYRNDKKTPRTFEQFVIWSIENHYHKCQPQRLQTTIVIDFTTGGAGTFVITIVPKLINILQKHYPELLGSALIVGAPKCFTGVWNTLKKIIDPDVLAKIVFCQKEDLPKYISGDPTPSP
jgi:hypothetical protein